MTLTQERLQILIVVGSRKDEGNQS